MRIKRLLITVFALLTVLYAAGQDYAHSSLLKQGRWIRLAVTEAGIYRLDFSQIREMGITDPSAAVLYGNNTGQLSFYNDGSAPDDLKKIAYKTEAGSDGIFNDGDYLLFYAEGTHRWIYDRNSDKYEYRRHFYSDTAWYFITSVPGGAARIANEPAPSQPHNMVSSSGDVMWRHEKETVNLISSGREWYQQVIPGTENAVNPPFKDLVTAEQIRYNLRVLGRSDTESSFILKQGSTVVETVSVPPVSMTDLNGVYANIAFKQDSCLPASAAPSFTVTFRNNGNLAATGYIDYIDFFARSLLKSTDKQLFISDSRSVESAGVTRFTVSGSSGLQVWDVTDPFAPKMLETTSLAGSTIFIAATDSLRKFVAFATAQALRPSISKEPVPNQDLHALGTADMIIVTHPLFREYAQRIANIHQADDGTSSIIVTPGQIYNEFSGGIPDAAAIRNFIRMIYSRGTEGGSPLKYLLLFGDGSYENKTPPPGNTSFIPTWQSVNSHVGVLSFTSDDFYGLLDDGEGEADGFLDIGIGRLPASDTAAAGIMVRKISSYIDNSAMGSWRNVLCMVADDEDANLHMMDAENLTVAAKEAAPPLTAEKIYLDAFRQVTTATGNSYPDAEKAINNRIAAGCLILNYVGHGNESGLAHERVVRTDDINSWKNKNMLPLFITATCEFSRFDDVEINQATGLISSRTSAGEMVLLNPEGGGIGLMSTTRVVYSAPNYLLNRKIYDYIFSTAPDGRSMKLGDIIRLAKINSGSGMNKRNFLLLGDPALRIAWPVQGRVVTDSINSVSVEVATDTVKALSLITITGHIEDNAGNSMDGFNGVVEPVVYDKVSTVSTLANDGGSPMSFPVTGNVIFRGTTTVNDGKFSFSFIVPLDINYSFGNGFITYYAHDDNRDVNGSFSEIVVGGFSDININDTEGPVIKLYLNDTLFNEGGITDTAPSLLALISDESGVNATGTGIGHDIIAWIDDDMPNAVVLNGLFSADIGVHTSGSLTYPFIISEKGEHTVSLRAWDNVNNPSVATLRFVVETSGVFRLTDLLCFPNPVTETATFTAGHNRPDTEIDVTITILNTGGSIVRIIREQFYSTGYSLPDIAWDGCNENGSRLARGMYLWRAEAVTADGERASATGRIIIL
jgi:hypothetical protein